jgi:hypothetical protein
MSFVSVRIAIPAACRGAKSRLPLGVIVFALGVALSSLSDKGQEFMLEVAGMLAGALVWVFFSKKSSKLELGEW